MNEISELDGVVPPKNGMSVSFVLISMLLFFCRGTFLF